MRNEINGIRVDNKNYLVDSDSAPMLIIGGGKNMWNDYLEARKILPSSNVMCVNDIAGQFKAEPIQHIVSLHQRLIPALKIMRQEKDLEGSVITHSKKPGPDVDISWGMKASGGTSGMFAMKIALVMGSKHIILCGIPIDNSGHYFDPPEIDKNNTTKFSENHSAFGPWRRLKKNALIMDRVRSMSGNTASFFGKPTKEWVQS